MRKCRALCAGTELAVENGSWIRMPLRYRSGSTCVKFVSEVSIPSIFTFLAAFKACSVSREIDLGRRIHEAAVENGDFSSNFVAAAAVDMYSRCGSMLEARKVFESSVNPDVAVWNALVVGYVRNRESKLALEIFFTMDCQANSRSYVAVITACSSMAAEEQGREVDGKSVKILSLQRGMEGHSRAVRSGCDSGAQIILENALVDMYGKCGSLVDARRVFDRMMFHDVISWNSLMVGCVDNGECELALDLFGWIHHQESTELLVNPRVYVTAFMACSQKAGKEEGRMVSGRFVKVESLAKAMEAHSLASRRKYDQLDIFGGNTLVDLYSKCVSITDARRAFDRMRNHDVVSWTSLIMGYTANDEAELAFELFSVMKAQGFCELDSGAFLAASMACSSMADQEDGALSHSDSIIIKPRSLEKVMEVHSQFLEHGCYNNTGAVVQNSLIDAYSRCGSMVDAKSVFDTIENPTVISWNALMLGYEENDKSELTLELFKTMVQQRLCSPNARSFVAALMACATLAAKDDSAHGKVSFLETGISIHGEAERLSYDSDIFVRSALINMYAKCGNLVEARRVFDSDENRDVVLWTVLVLGYAENSEPETALELFDDMQRRETDQVEDCREKHQPNAGTFLAALTACSAILPAHSDSNNRIKCLEKVMAIHSKATELGYNTVIFVANRLIDLYAKCGDLSDARRVFIAMPRHDVISWATLVLGYVENGDSKLGLELFQCMLEAGCVADSGAFVTGLKGAGSVADFATGSWLHREICKGGLESDEAVAVALVDFYGKCGCMAASQHIFDSSVLSTSSSVVPWNALLAGYSHKGDSKSVFDCFQAMSDAGVGPDEISMVLLLSALSHAGLVDKGRQCFEEMTPKYGLVPGIEHYTCVVDLLARANLLDEAVEMVKTMPVEADYKIWSAVLGACWKYKNAQVGKLAFDNMVKIDPSRRQVSPYVLMSNIYEALGMVDERECLYNSLLNTIED